MRKPLLGLYEKAMPDEVDWSVRLAAAAAAGFDFVELSVDESDARLARLDWPRAQRREMASLGEQAGAPLRTLCLSGHRRFPLGSSDAAVRRRSLEILEGAVELAYDVGIRIVQLAGYDVFYDEPSTPATREQFLDSLHLACRQAACRGVVLAFETMENDFMNTVAKAMDVVRTIDSPYLQVYPDVGNVTNAWEGEAAAVSADLRGGAGHLAAAHLKETVPGVFRNRFYGDGWVDFAGATRTLRALGVGLFTAEFWYDPAAGPWQERLCRAHDFLRPLLAATP